MELITAFIEANLMYWHELWWTLALGFLLSGIFYNYIPQSFVERHLSAQGLKPIGVASVVGVILPVCCLGSLPIAITLRRKGASLGAVMAFLVATPATSASALFVAWKLLGIGFTVYISAAIILMAVFIGLAVNALNVPPMTNGDNNSCCHDERAGGGNASPLGKIKDTLRYSFIELPRNIGVEIIIGILLASFITVFEPLQTLIQSYLSGAVGYAFILVFGLVTYVCSTASVPLADALIQSGMSMGQGMCYLIAGPITSYGTILVIRKDFGGKVLGVYLIIISILSIVSGLVFDGLAG